MVWVTHDTEEAISIASRVTFLADGAVVQQGLSAEVFNSPASSVVADYLGINVWLNGVVEADGNGSTRLVLPGGASLVCAEAQPGPAVACVHPEDVVLFTSRPRAATTSLRNVVKGTVSGLRPLGRSFVVTVGWEGGRLDALLTRAACDELQIAPGLVVYAGVKATAMKVASGALVGNERRSDDRRPPEHEAPRSRPESSGGLRRPRRAQPGRGRLLGGRLVGGLDVAPAEPSSVTATQVVALSEASSRIGEVVIVEGPVVERDTGGQRQPCGDAPEHPRPRRTRHDPVRGRHSRQHPRQVPAAAGGHLRGHARPCLRQDRRLRRCLGDQGRFTAPDQDHRVT